MNQAELQALTNERIRDAEVLLGGGRWAFAYYVSGYAIECALKSCVLERMVLTGGVFKEKKFAEQCFTHDFAELIRLAGLTNELNNQFAASAGAAGTGAKGGAFVGNWGLVTQWKESARYESKTEKEARDLLTAITDESDGVLRWIQKYW